VKQLAPGSDPKHIFKFRSQAIYREVQARMMPHIGQHRQARQDLERYYFLLPMMLQEVQDLSLSEQDFLALDYALPPVFMDPPMMAAIVEARLQRHPEWGPEASRLRALLSGLSPGAMMALIDALERRRVLLLKGQTAFDVWYQVGLKKNAEQ
jgi:hypothetical protein